MKRTIKQWCIEHGVGWLGQGSTGNIRYDWKLVLGKGRTAVFSTTVDGDLPQTRRLGERDILVFPNVNRSKDGGKITEAAFLRIIKWVDDCLDGNLSKLEAPNPEFYRNRRKNQFAPVCFDLPATTFKSAHSVRKDHSGESAQSPRNTRIPRKNDRTGKSGLPRVPPGT